MALPRVLTCGNDMSKDKSKNGCILISLYTWHVKQVIDDFVNPKRLF